MSDKVDNEFINSLVDDYKDRLIVDGKLHTVNLKAMLRTVVHETRAVAKNEINAALDNIRANTRVTAEVSDYEEMHADDNKVRYGCHCECESTVSGEPDDCVIDSLAYEDCVYAKPGMLKEECKYWKSF